MLFTEGHEVWAGVLKSRFASEGKRPFACLFSRAMDMVNVFSRMSALRPICCHILANRITTPLISTDAVRSFPSGSGIEPVIHMPFTVEVLVDGCMCSGQYEPVLATPVQPSSVQNLIAITLLVRQRTVR